MNFQLPLQLAEFPNRISYGDRILLAGSCFTEHIGDHLSSLKFHVLQNPNGILFDPLQIARSLVSYIKPHEYRAEDLVYFNELWQSWHHHSRFSHIHQRDCLEALHASQQQAHDFLKKADWLILTLGSSFSYRLTDKALQPSRDPKPGMPVANCHRAPASWFSKQLTTVPEIHSELREALREVMAFNPRLKVLMTISPVRHIRDGVVENNRSKARLIEVVHQLVQEMDKVYYFPAYEWVVDVLRDYRFYDLDLVHPNYAATGYVMEQFMKNIVDENSRQLSEQVQEVVTARRHKPFQPKTSAHQQFLMTYAGKCRSLMAAYPFLDFSEELDYFQSATPKS